MSQTRSLPRNYLQEISEMMRDKRFKDICAKCTETIRNQHGEIPPYSESNEEEQDEQQPT